MEWISTKDRLPEDGETVLIFEDYYWGIGINVAKFERGISIEEREKMKRGEIDDPVHTVWDNNSGKIDVKRSDSYYRADEDGNNKVPYCWVVNSGSMKCFGQHVSHWMPLPAPPEVK